MKAVFRLPKAASQAVQFATEQLLALFARPGGWSLAEAEKGSKGYVNTSEARQLLEPLESLPIQDLGVKDSLGSVWICKAVLKLYFIDFQCISFYFQRSVALRSCLFTSPTLPVPC